MAKSNDKCLPWESGSRMVFPEYQFMPVKHRIAAAKYPFSKVDEAGCAVEVDIHGHMPVAKYKIVEMLPFQNLSRKYNLFFFFLPLKCF